MKDPWSPFVKDTSKIQITETRWSFGFSGYAKCKARATCLISQSCWIYYDGLCNSPRWWIIYVLDYYFSFGVYFCWGFGREKKRKRELPPVARTTDLLLAFSASCGNRTDIRSVRVESLYSSCYCAKSSSSAIIYLYHRTAVLSAEWWLMRTLIYI